MSCERTHKLIIKGHCTQTLTNLFLQLSLLLLLPGLPTGRYMYVRCNPNGDQSNCITHRGPQMELNPDLPSRLPASAAEYMYVCTFVCVCMYVCLYVCVCVTERERERERERE
uniref:Uncharacterized protein n=1 Tax=Myripristis murdjan TaxID=586833 RepID=A0A668ATT0_9TELE